VGIRLGRLILIFLLVCARARSEEAHPLKEVLDIGKRAVELLALLDAKRGPLPNVAVKIKPPAGMATIENPVIYNVPMVRAYFDKAMSGVDRGLRALLTAKEVDAGFSDESLRPKLLSLVQAYLVASRWLYHSPNIMALMRKRQKDVRGYYHLARREKTKEMKDEWLLGICFNTEADDKKCREKLDIAKKNNTVQEFYDTYFSNAERLFGSFFEISAPRSDIYWRDGVLHVAFRSTNNEKINTWLKETVENTWKGTNWKLTVDFTDSASAPYILFEKGATPHVSNTNEMVLDANMNTGDAITNMTVAHEFGHILGFRDCYVEFFDTQLDAMVNYQIDQNNIMCSTAGDVLPSHFEELKRAYTH
jgi:hypothetical protein